MQPALLIVDDEHSVLNAIKREFNRFPYPLLCADNCYDALNILHANEVGVVISDYVMPEMDGIRFLARVRDLYPQTFRILLTGNADLKTLTEAVNQSAIYKFFVKPWSSRELRLIVDETFRHYHLERENKRLTDELHRVNSELKKLNTGLEASVVEKSKALMQAMYFDTLTRLPNRLHLEDHLTGIIDSNKKFNAPVSILYLGVDRFKIINDSLGRSVGDELLRIIAGRLSSCIRTNDFIAKLSGDTFCIVLSDHHSNAMREKVVQRLLAAVSQPCLANNRSIVLTGTVGIAAFPNDGEDVQILLRNAETAMNHAKELGGDRYQVYSVDFNIRAEKRLSIETELRRAVDNEEFRLHFQPRVSANSFRIVAAEALLRWHHPERGLVPPNQFIPILEDTGLIVQAGEWVIRSACSMIERLQSPGIPPIRISVNISPVQLKHKSFLENICAITENYNITPENNPLEFEITESLLIDDIEATIHIMQALNEKGFLFAIDDFGIGYSALSYLSRYPLHCLKVDRSFISNLGNSEDAGSIANIIISLAKSLKLKSVVEGVEKKHQMEFMRRLGCDEFQGFYFSKPVPEDEFLRLLKLGVPLPGPPQAGFTIAHKD